MLEIDNWLNENSCEETDIIVYFYLLNRWIYTFMYDISLIRLKEWYESRLLTLLILIDAISV